MEIEFADVTEAFQRNSKLVNHKDRVSSFAKQLNATKFQSNWIMVEGKTYLVKVLLFDRDRHPILLTKNLEFVHSYDKGFFTMVDQNLIGSEMIVKVVAHSHHGTPTPAHRTIFVSSLK